MKKETTIVKVKTAREIAGALRNVLVNMIEVSRDYVAALEVRPEIKQELRDLGVQVHTLTRMELIGRGSVDERLALQHYSAANRLLALPISDQKAMLDDGVEVMESNGDVRRIPVDQLSSKQVAQVFNGSGLRTLAQQRTWLTEHAGRPLNVEEPDWKIGRDSVTIRKGGKFSRALIASWLAQMG
jgi:hypothetical protein